MDFLRPITEHSDKLESKIARDSAVDGLAAQTVTEESSSPIADVYRKIRYGRNLSIVKKEERDARAIRLANLGER